MLNKILITGGAGFLGSHLCDALLARGDEVIVVDNFISGSRENLKHLTDNPNFTLLEHDVSLPLPSPIEGLSAIYHFASPASPNPNSQVSYITNPIETLMVNSVGTKYMLDLANQNNCQIILASTSEVYGDPEVHPQTEDYWGHVSPNGVRSCYDEGKRFLEAISFAYYRTHQTKIKVIRIFNTYGPRMLLEEGRFIPTLVDCALHHKPFSRFGDGSSSRSFCYVGDLIAGIVKVSDTEGAIGEVINLGNPKEYTINEVIEIIEGLTGQPITLDPQPPLPDDPKRRKPDLTKAKSLLNWTPTIAIKDGLSKMLASYGKN